MPLQDWIYHWGEGAGGRSLKVAAAVLGFVALATLYDVLAFEGFSSEEAMETAQVARNLSEGKGYVTKSIRPLSIYLLQRSGPAGVALPAADLSNPPVYPVLLAGSMKVLPFHFTANQYWFYAAGTVDCVFQSRAFPGGGAAALSDWAAAF